MALIKHSRAITAPINCCAALLVLIFLLATSQHAHSQQDYFSIQLGEYPANNVVIKKNLQHLLPLQTFVESNNKGETWRLGIGFLGTRIEAENIARSLQGDYPQLAIVQLTAEQFDAIQASRAPPWTNPNQESTLIIPIDSRAMINTQLKRAAKLYSAGDYANAAILYQLLSQVPAPEQAAWALELYGVCLEKQYQHEPAMAVYAGWLQQYPDSSSKPRVQQRLLALNTATAKPPPARKKTSPRRNDVTAIYGSTSLVYTGLQTKISGEDPETTINALAANIDLHIRARTGALLIRSRVTGGYISDQSERENSDGQVSNLNLSLLHEASGAELIIGRQRSNDHGVFGYLDGAVFSYPVTGKIAINLLAGTVNSSSTESPNSDRWVYSVSTDIQFADPGWQLHLYAVEQTYEGITERRAVGTETSYFNDYSHYLLIADYDTEFSEVNNVLLNSSWDITETTNVSLSIGYQRSPFLTASNALIGEFDIDLDELADSLDAGIDIYDAALDKTATSQYASLIVNQQLSQRLRLIAELYHYELSDLPQFDPAFSSPDSDASTTVGLQFLLAQALFNNDYLSTGLRYTEGDSSNSASVFIDEKLKFNPDINLTLRLLASKRWVDGLNQDAYSLRPAIRLDWYFTRSLLLDMEMGYEWSTQDFESGDLDVQQAFIAAGLHQRF